MSWEVKNIDSMEMIEVVYFWHITRLDLEQVVKKRIEIQAETGS